MKTVSKLNQLAVLAAVGALSIPSFSQAETINVDINKGAAPTYSGTAAAPDSGTVWNGLAIDESRGTNTLGSVVDSQGNPIPVSISIDSGDSGSHAYINGSSDAGNPSPMDLMADYTYWETYTVTIRGLASGKYTFYGYGHGDSAGQSSTFTLSARNGGASASTTDFNEFRNIEQTNALNNSYVKLNATVGDSGVFTFSAKYINGFQLVALPEPATLGLIGFFGVGALLLRRCD